MDLWIIPLIIYVGCAILTYGMELGYYQREFNLIADEDYWSDVALSALIALVPFSILVSVFSTEGIKHGFMYRRKKDGNRKTSTPAYSGSSQGTSSTNQGTCPNCSGTCYIAPPPTYTLRTCPTCHATGNGGIGAPKPLIPGGGIFKAPLMCHNCGAVSGGYGGLCGACGGGRTSF